MRGERGQLFVCNAGIRVVTPIYTVHCAFMKARDPEREREIKTENGEDYKGSAGSFIGQMSCVHYKRRTRSSLNPGIRSVRQPSHRPLGRLCARFTPWMEPMCHVCVV